MKIANIALDLDYCYDGICGKVLAVVDGPSSPVQYALGVTACIDGSVNGEVFRRTIPANGAHPGYGGWRWECSPVHVMRYPGAYPSAIGAALQAIGYR